MLNEQSHVVLHFLILNEYAGKKKKESICVRPFVLLLSDRNSTARHTATANIDPAVREEKLAE